MRKLFRCCLVGALLLCLAACGGPREVSDMPYSLDYEGETLEGTYTGTTVEDLPGGEGTFTCMDEDVTFEYTGTWEEGKMVGEGELETNIYVVHFKDGIDRIGEFEGNTLDGKPSGEGKFTATNDEGNTYCYEGNWEKGVWSGEGKRYFLNYKTWIEKGNFSNNEFDPTPVEYFTAEGTHPDKRYDVSGNAAAFLEKYPDIFLNNTTEGSEAQIDTSFSYNAFSKNPTMYGSKLIKVSNLYVVQIFEENYYGADHTYMILDKTNGYGGEVYYVNMYGHAEDIYEGSRVTLTALPLDFFTYPNVADQSIWAVACAGVSVE